jgi:hypothetical protein
MCIILLRPWYATGAKTETTSEHLKRFELIVNDV